MTQKPNNPKNIQDVVAERVEEFDTKFISHSLRFDDKPLQSGRVTDEIKDWLTTTLTQLVKEVEAGERERCIEVIETAHSLEHKHDTEDYSLGFQGACSYLWVKLTPPTSDEIEK